MEVDVYVVGQDVIEKEFTFFETALQSLRFCDHLIFVDGGSVDGTLELVKYKARKDLRLAVYSNFWEEHMRRSIFSIQKNAALSRCHGDWCLLFDADEVPGDDFVERIRECIKEADSDGKLAIRFRTLHFYRDYEHTCFKDPIKGYDWYEGKIYAIKNNLGIHHGNADGDPDGFVDNNDEAIPPVETFLTNLTVFHYGHVRSPEVYLEKKNAIERRFHLDWKDLKEWGFAGVNDERYFRRFEGKHPEIMSERIKLQMPLKHEDVVEYYKKFLEEKWL